MKTYHNLPSVLAACAVLSFSVAAPADILLETGFDGSTGHHVFAGNTDNVTGSSALTVNWTTDASVTSISGLTALSTTSGGFATLQGGTAAYANPDVVYLSRNLNLDDRATNQRGFSFDFTTDTDWTLDSITVVAEHTNNQGTQNQAYTSDLHYSLTGPAALSGIITVDYTQNALPWLTTTFTDNAGATLGSGDYTLSVYMSNMVGGGAYASYDGVSIEVSAIPEPATALLLGLGLLAVVRRRR